MTTNINDFFTLQAHAQLLLIPDMPITEQTSDYARETYLGLRKWVNNITDASIRPDVSRSTTRTAQHLLETVEKIRQTTIPALKNKFSLGLSPGAESVIKLGSFLAVLGFDYYTDILGSIQNYFIKNLIIGIAAQQLNNAITFNID